MRVELDNGKYAIEENNGIMRAFRYGEPWDTKTKDLIGDKFTLCLLQHIENLDEEISKLKQNLRGQGDIMDGIIKCLCKTDCLEYKQFINGNEYNFSTFNGKYMVYNEDSEISWFTESEMNEWFFIYLELEEK